MSDFKEPFERWRLTRIINVSGTMTSLGASKVAPEVVDAVSGVLPSFVFIDELQARASRIIAKATGAEAGCVTACSAAAMTLGCAATITGSDLAAIEALPDCGVKENRIAVQAGHLVNYGAPIGQAVRLSGAELVSLGSAALCELYHLEHAISTGLAAALYVVSHHTVREGELPMDLFIERCREASVPVIVDMASEYDLQGPIALGADIVIYSGHKFLSGVTSGIAAGREELVRALYLQNRGIGRTMKVGKEGIIGAMAALERWATRDHGQMQTEELERVTQWEATLGDVPGLTLARHADWTGNPITRLRVTVEPQRAGLYAWELTARLAARQPAVVVRDDLVEHGYFFLDPCNVDNDEATTVGDAIQSECELVRAAGDGLQMSWSEVKRARAQTPLRVLAESAP